MKIETFISSKVGCRVALLLLCALIWFLTCRPLSLSLVSIDKKHVKGKLSSCQRNNNKFNFVDFLFLLHKIPQ